MFAKINRGDRMAGLMVYLQGPGRRDEHTRPHIVAGDAGVMSWYAGEEELTRAQALRVAKYLERPTKVLNESVKKGRYEQVAAGRDGHGTRVLERTKTGEVDAHVYQIALSARAEEGELGDEVWREIAGEFVDRMGITSGDAPTRWAAVHHGLSASGNDHIHIVVNLVREDASKVSTHMDFLRAKEVCRELETEFGLMPLNPNEYDLTRSSVRAEYETARRREQATPGGNPRIPWAELDEPGQHQLMAAHVADPAEWRRILETREEHADPDVAAKFKHQGAQEKAARVAYEKRVQAGEESTPWSGLSKSARTRLVEAAEDPKVRLARTVRACSTAAEDEAEFVRRLRQNGLLVRPRFEKGRTDIVTGYSIATRPDKGERPIWRGGGSIARDLSLPRLRQQWPDDPTTASAAVQEWTAAKNRKPPVARGREATKPGPEVWAKATADLTQLRTQLREIAPDDYATWARVARESSGILAAWSHRVEKTPGPLAATSDILARSAETSTSVERRLETTRTRGRLPSISGAAYLLLAAGGTGPAAELAMLKAVMNLSKALYDMHKSSQDALRALRIETVIRGQLMSVARRLQDEARAAALATEQNVEKIGPRTPAAGTTTTLDPRAEEAMRLRRDAFGDAPVAPSKTPPTASPVDRPRPNQTPGQTPGRAPGKTPPGQTPGQRRGRGRDR